MKWLPIFKGMDFFPHDLRLPFMKYKGPAIALSVVAMLLSLTVFFVKGLNYGIDFKGGLVIEVQTVSGGPADISHLREKLGKLGVGAVQIQEFGSPSDVMIRVEQQPGGEEAQQVALKKVQDALQGEFVSRRTEIVGPAVSSELRFTGFLAVFVGVLAITAYVWFRFEWQFAIGAIVATLHDLLLTIGLFVFTGLEFDITSIAAILTIVGYSLNDTVVVYDRMRENLRRYKKMPLELLIDTSINSTLSRTILTSVTTMIAIAALVLFGGEVIRGFTISMLFGVLVGTFSSIYIAAPILILFKLRSDAFDKKDEKDEKSGEAQAV